MKSIKLTIFIALLVSFFFICPGSAEASFSDELSSSVPNAWAYHTIKWQVIDSSGIIPGESFVISFDSSFSFSNIEINNITLRVNDITRNLINSCGADTDIAANIVGSEINFLLCPGAGIISQNDQIFVLIGDTVDNSHQVRNASSPGGYYVDMSGESGYTDTARSEMILSAGNTTYFNIAPLTGNLILSGRSSPGAIIYIYESDSLIGTDNADSSGYFYKIINSLSLGIHSVGIWCRDIDGNNSEILTYQFNINQALDTQISGVLLPPTTISVANIVKRSAPLWLSGRTFSAGKVNLSLTSTKDNYNFDYLADDDGLFNANLNPKLHLGVKNYSNVAYDGLGGISTATTPKSFEVVRTSDINNDNIVDGKDLDLYKLDYNSTCLNEILNDINDDGSCGLSDLSIMMYDWSK